MVSFRKAANILAEKSLRVPEKTRAQEGHEAGSPLGRRIPQEKLAQCAFQIFSALALLYVGQSLDRGMEYKIEVAGDQRLAVDLGRE